jgi:hypothetical protein
LAGILLRLAIFVAAIVVATWVSAVVKDALDLQVMPRNEQAVHRAILGATAVFVVLLAIPFVPGAEIGLTMLTVFGAPIAPLVYGATVVALVLAYAIGRLVPPAMLARGLWAVGLRRAGDAVAEAEGLSRADRLARIAGDGSPKALRALARYRYAALLLAINLPGNVVIGGGGGIALMAGMSGLFSPLPYVATVMVAVSPVPLAILLLGS